MEKTILDKITDEEVRQEIVRLLDEKAKKEAELETARQTAKLLKEKAEKLEVINTDLYSRVVAGTVVNDKKQETKEEPKTKVEVFSDIAQKLKAKK